MSLLAAQCYIFKLVPLNPWPSLFNPKPASITLRPRFVPMVPSPSPLMSFIRAWRTKACCCWYAGFHVLSTCFYWSTVWCLRSIRKLVLFAFCIILSEYFYSFFSFPCTCFFQRISTAFLDAVHIGLILCHHVLQPFNTAVMFIMCDKGFICIALPSRPAIIYCYWWKSK